MLKIGEFSKLSRVSVRMLRHYDEIGLLKPAEIDRFTDYRYYREDQLPIAGRIAALKDMGFSLADIVRILEAYDDREKLDQFFSARQEELEALSRDTAYKLTLLDAARKRLRKEEDMSYNVTLKTIPERYAATIRMIIPRYEDEGMIWGKLTEETCRMNYLSRRRIQGRKCGYDGVEDRQGKLSRYGACEVPHASGGNGRKLYLPGKLHSNHGCLCCCDRMDGSERLRACWADVQYLPCKPARDTEPR